LEFRSFCLPKELETWKLLFSAESAAIYQPSPQGWVRGKKRGRGLKARDKKPVFPTLLEADPTAICGYRLAIAALEAPAKT
jgi:hypothetical protein